MSSSGRWVFALFAALWAAWMLALGTGQARRIPGLSSDLSEPVQHFLAFAILAALVMFTVRSRPLVVFTALIAVGLAGELIQLTTSNRQFAWVDVFMDAIGAALGIALAVRVPRRAVQRSVIALTVVLMVVAPIAPDATHVVPLTYPEDCGEPPPPTGTKPNVILEESSLSAVPIPHKIDEPSVAEIRERILVSNELTVEAWFETTDLNQTGPVRVFTISEGTREDQVNLHIGIDGDDVSIRLRTSCNIFKWVGAKNVIQTDGPQHVIFTWQEAQLAVWVNGVMVNVTNNRWGDFARWDPGFDIIVGDEKGGGRRFDGTVYSVTMWDAALADDTIIKRSRQSPG